MRHRTPVGTGAWTTSAGTTTTGTLLQFFLTDLAQASEYRVQASIGSGFTTTVQHDFTTLSPMVATLSVSEQTRTSALMTLGIEHPAADEVDFYLRWRTPPDSGTWSEATVAAAGTTVHHRLTGLAEGQFFRAQASHDNTFPAAGTVEVDFMTTANVQPEFPSATATRQVQENSPAGTFVGDPLTATDADLDAITYSISGTDAAFFTIVALTGQIMVSAGVDLDYETTDSYSVTVTASDGNGGTDTVAVTIEILDLDEAGALGKIIIRVGRDGTSLDYGFTSGEFGTLVSGEWPGGLFDDGLARAVGEIWEDADGHWYFAYSGGLISDWLSDAEKLDNLMLTVSYYDQDDVLTGINTRQFVLGGFIVEEFGTLGLRLSPPLPSR